MMTVQSQTPIELVKRVYSNLEDRLDSGRKALGRPLTLAEKILINHLKDPSSTEMNRGVSYVDLHPDRVAMQDATAQMALLQFMQAGKTSVAVPTTVHCDHLIQAKDGANIDLKSGLEIEAERFSDLFETDETSEGLTAFVQKRPPKY